MLKVFEAFAGVGSQRMALRNLGIEHKVVGICEIDKFALKSYEAIHGDCPNFGDISKIDANDLPNMDLFTYSFPCQDLSIAGKQKGLGEGTRSGLLYECEKIIKIKKPKYLLLENVKNLVSKKFKNDFNEWLRYLEKLGYKNYWKILNAKDYGIPQNRERVFVISILDNIAGYEFPPTTKIDKCIKDILESDVSDKLFLSGEWGYKLFSKRESVCKQIGEYYSYSYDQARRIYSIDYCCPALTTMQGGGKKPKILVNDKVREISSLEAWRLMGFKDEDYLKAKKAGVPIAQLYKQAGNSIVANVLEGIFENLFLYKDKTEKDLVKTTTVKIKNKNIEYNQLKWVL
jgi:DNA (cytosine-5)-methyltransferase 1